MTSARALVADAALWPHVRSFLWDFAPLIHPSHLSGGKRIVEDASPRLKSYVLAAHDVKPCFHDFPADDASRLLLLDAETLDSVAKWLGALAFADSLRRVMKADEVKALKSSLKGVYPDVFSYQPYFAKFAGGESSGPAPSPDEIAAEGYAQLFSLFSGMPEQLLARLRLVLPEGTPLPAKEAATRGADAKKRLLDKVLLLLKLKFPEAYQLCSS